MNTRPDLALFDFDGTLTTCETFPAFLRHVLPRSRLLSGWLRLWPLVLGYRCGVVSGLRLRAALARLAFTGAEAQRLAVAGDEFARSYLPGVMRAEALARVNWHRRRGDRVVVVSGGLGLYLRPWAEAEGLELLCSELEVDGSVCTGAYAGAQCVGAEKARRVCEWIDLADYAQVHAYGDTPEDAALLAIADHRHYRGRPLVAAAAP